MAVLRREFYNVSRADEFVIVPLGDVHIGNEAADEGLLKHVVEGIQHRHNCYWIGMGDYCEFINVKDRRFEAKDMASWIEVTDLSDIAKVQMDRFCQFIKPIADRCLGLVEGNHEQDIRHHCERDVYFNIVSFIKKAGGIDHKLALEMEGWLRLVFYRCGPDERKQRGTKVDISLHHGFVGGKLSGAKSLNIQRWAWSHICDLVLWGHSHNILGQPEGREYLDRHGNVRIQNVKGAISGSFLPRPGYARRKGYFPLPYGGCEIILRPGNADSKFDDVVSVVV